MTQPTIEISRTQIRDFVIAFRKRATLGNISSLDILVYNLVRGLPADRGFSPVTNSNKLANGHRANDGFNNAVSQFKFRTTWRDEHRAALAKQYHDILTSEQLLALGQQVTRL